MILQEAISTSQTAVLRGHEVDVDAERVCRWTTPGEPATTALLVIDMQIDFLDAAGRLPVDQRRVPDLVRNVNAAIDEAEGLGMLVVHIGNEFPRASLLNPFRKFAAIAGSPGAALDPRVSRGGSHYVAKRASDAFSSQPLRDLLTEKRIVTVALAGVFANGCVKASARGALGLGYRTVVLADAVASRSDRATARSLEAMRRLGAAIAYVEPEKGSAP